MVEARNGWFCTDSDCLQHSKQVGEKEWSFVQAVWLDTDNADDVYAICAGNIDLDLYSENDMEGAISSYGYTMESIKEIYGDESSYIIAECLFEDDCLYDPYSIAGVVSLKDAELIIQNYIDER